MWFLFIHLTYCIPYKSTTDSKLFTNANTLYIYVMCVQTEEDLPPRVVTHF